MTTDKARTLLLDELERLLHGGKLEFAGVWRQPSAATLNLFQTESQHFEIVLSGKLPLLLPCDSGFEERLLHPGDVFHLAPGYGAGRRNDTSRELLVVNFHPEGVECYHSHHKFEKGEASSTRISYHSSIPMELGGMHLLHAFDFYLRERRDGILTPLFHQILSAIGDNLRCDRTGATTRMRLTYKTILRHMREKCLSPINRKTIAAEFNLSPDYLTHLFKKFNSSTFHAVLTGMRMEQAARCLRQPDLNVAQVSALCGFDEPSYFIKVFRHSYGMTPGEFRSREIGRQ